jgi:hypothetical protein
MPSSNLATELQLPQHIYTRALAVVTFGRMLLNEVIRLGWRVGCGGAGGVLIVLAVLTIVYGGDPTPTPTPTPIPF